MSMEYETLDMALSSSGLGRSPLKAKTGVRIPVGSLGSLKRAIP